MLEQCIDQMHDAAIPTVEQARQYINAIDFSNIINKLVNYHGWLRKEALAVCEMYRRFLFLNKKHQESLPPSEEIDEFWHMHILDTKKYIVDCQHIFGKYFHHYPYFGIDDKTDQMDLDNAFEKTQKLYASEFNGQQIYVTRGIFAESRALLRCFLNDFRRKTVSLFRG